MINKKTKKIILLEFKRTSDSGECYFQDMWKVTEKKHTPILTGLRALETVWAKWHVRVRKLFYFIFFLKKLRKKKFLDFFIFFSQKT